MTRCQGKETSFQLFISCVPPRHAFSNTFIRGSWPTLSSQKQNTPGLRDTLQ
ncbi:hypothetical protein Bpfe_000902, partial [Biomphalaria pfeifferi]